MAKDSRHIVLHAKGNQRRQWSSDIPRQVESPNESPFFRAFFSGFTTKEHGYLCNDYDMFLGENRNTRGCQKLKWACFRSLTPPEVSWWLDQWGNGPPKLLLASLGEQKSGRCRQRLKATSSSKPFSKWPFMQPVAVPASAVVFIWWHLIEKVIFSLYKNKVWASCNTGTKDTLYSQDWFHSLEDTRLGSQFLLFPCKSDLSFPGHCANLFFHSPYYPLKFLLYIFIYIHMHTKYVCIYIFFKCG